MDVNKAKKVIEKMERTFSSHKFIKEYAFQNQKEYIEALQEKVQSGSPFEIVHQQIGRFLLDNAEELHIKHIGDKMSDNIFGHKNMVAKWENLNAQ